MTRPVCGRGVVTGYVERRCRRNAGRVARRDQERTHMRDCRHGLRRLLLTTALNNVGVKIGKKSSFRMRVKDAGATARVTIKI